MADFINNIFGIGDSWVGYLIAALIAAVLILHVVAVGALLFIWMERKISGRIQDRLGPTRVGGKYGWLQTLADGIKLIAKEDITPDLADRFLFKIAPYVGLAASYAAFIALPFADGVVAQHVNTAVFFVLAVLGLEVFSVILAGYASGSKWSLFGAMREAAQVVSYEVPLGMCVVVPVMICGTMNLTTIGNMQAGLFTNWLVFNDPFTFLTAIIYFTCATAGVNRAPFDLLKRKVNWSPDSIRSIQDCVGVYSSWLNTARCLLSQLWQVSCSLAAHTARFRLGNGLVRPSVEPGV